MFSLACDFRDLIFWDEKESWLKSAWHVTLVVEGMVLMKPEQECEACQWIILSVFAQPQSPFMIPAASTEMPVVVVPERSEESAAQWYTLVTFRTGPPCRVLPQWLLVTLIRITYLCGDLFMLSELWSLCCNLGVGWFLSVFKGNNPMNIPAGGITTDQQPPNLISESALPTSLGATK